MLRFYAHHYVRMSQKLTRIEELSKNESGSLSDSDKKVVEKELADIIMQAVDMGCLDLSAIFAERVLKSFKIPDNPITHKELGDAMGTLRDRIADELSKSHFLLVENRKQSYLDEIQPFGENVAKAFPASLKDVEEAAKCLALDRSTATVYHLMRVMEDGLKALARLLGIPYAPSWESYINQINIKISQKYKRKGVRWKRDEPFFKEILGSIESVKISWRNPTMHIVRHYDLEEAEQIFASVRIFMQRLAKKIT